MAKNLLIVESPTKSHIIEKFLGKDYTVKACMGHVRDLPKRSYGVNVANGFKPFYTIIPDKKALINELKSLAQNADNVYLATDPDREGEAISYHLANLLGFPDDKICRVTFHEITKNAVIEAMKKPRCIDLDMFNAQQARRVLDRIVGYELSPLLWKWLHNKNLSAGRVQSVAVRIIADREAEIASFVPQEYWTMKVKLREQAKAQIFEAEVVKYKGKKLAIENAEQAQTVESALKNATYIVADASQKTRRRHALPPFTTSTLQQEANRKLNFSTARTMLLAQQLYEGVNLGDTSLGLITYMRTDSVRLADSARAEIKEYILKNYGKEYYPPKPNFYRGRSSAQDAHEAIRPTAIERTPEAVANYLTREQLRLYELIWKRTVASQMADAVYDATTLLLDARDYQLRANGSILKFNGFLQAYGNFADEEKELKVPWIAAGTELQLQELLPAEQHFTEPPAHYSEASLVKKLEEEGIGRPSTYAPTINTIIKRGYIAKNGKQLLLTDLGTKVNDFLLAYFAYLLDITFSADLETELDKIAVQEASYEEFISPFYRDLMAAKNLLLANPPPPPPPEYPDPPQICEKCGRQMVIKLGRYGKFLSCSGFPECSNSKPWSEKTAFACPKCGKEIEIRKSKTGKTYYSCTGYPNCNFSTWDKPIEDKCPVCGKNMVEHYAFRRRGRQLFCIDPSCSNSRHITQKNSSVDNDTGKKINHQEDQRKSKQAVKGRAIWEK